MFNYVIDDITIASILDKRRAYANGEIAMKVAQKYKGTVSNIESGLYLIEGNNKRYILTHPFGSKEYVETLKLKVEREVSSLSVFDAMRRGR